MALADFYGRTALAAAQVLEGFDEDIFRETLEATPVGIGFNGKAAASTEGQALLDLLVRLLARLYPVLEIRSDGAPAAAEAADGLRTLALSINPAVEFGKATVGIVVGEDAPEFAESFFVGCSGWDAHFSPDTPRKVGASSNPFGAGAAACIAAANVFRRVLLSGGQERFDGTLTLSTYDLERRDSPALTGPWDIGNVVLVGAGAIGNATLWALSRAPLTGEIRVVDHEPVELSNLQRYVLARRDQVGAPKVEVAAKAFAGDLHPKPYAMTWQRFVSKHGYDWDLVAVGVDNAPDRVAVQASLPRLVLNAWTQPGDLGVSIHPQFGAGSDACLACLYLPTTTAANEDETVAQALGIPDQVRVVRELLDSQKPLERSFLEAVALSLARPIDLLLPFEGRGIRELYVQGVCGGAILPLGAAGTPHQDVHVPLAHQSALAGVLLAAQIVRQRQGDAQPSTTVTTIDLMQPLTEFITLPRQRHPEKRCICVDPDFLSVFRQKWMTSKSKGILRPSKTGAR